MQDNNKEDIKEDIIVLKPKDPDAGGMAHLDSDTLKMVFETIVESEKEIRAAMGTLENKINSMANLIMRIECLQKNYFSD